MVIIELTVRQEVELGVVTLDKDVKIFTWKMGRISLSKGRALVECVQ